ncbi:hypothetical protein ABZO31_28350 [Streptomyces sp. HUAS MG47]|uniref:hypothetical protein n=1 Tax=Streptomyces solicamelliae TaxID=3231716 RepID=UPI003877A046
MTKHLRMSSIALAGGILAATLLAAAPAGADTASHASPAGCWKAQVTEGDMPPAEVELTFDADRTLKLTGPRDENGTPYFTGTGTWAPLSGGAFRFTVRHPLPGGPAGEARSSLDGELSSTRAFSAQGQTYHHYDDGTVGGPSTVTMTATRVSCV